MKKIALLLFLIPVFLFALPKPKPDEILVISHVTVIDVTGGPSKSDINVIITGDKITQIGPSDKTPAPQGAHVVDGSGKFLIPGLWDMHVHWYNEAFLPLFTANGVTGVRQMFGFPMHLQWRKDLEKGSLAGPRMSLASPIVDGPHPVWPDSISVHNEAEGRQTVKKVKQWGADFVKVYSLLPRDAYFGIADESKKEGIPFAGHVPFSVSAAEASDAGQKSIEHLTGVLLACSRNEDALRNELVSENTPAARMRADLKALDSYDDKKAAALFQKFVQNGTWQCPTLTVLRSSAYLDDNRFTSDGRIRYMPMPIRNRWIQRADNVNRNFGDARKVLQKEVQIVGAMRRANVQFLAGTDTGNPFCFPGFSLHDELTLLVIAGLTPIEALRAATLNPAKYLGMDQTLGTIETGKLADLVLLDADPLQDIKNTQKIESVIENGRLYDRKALNRMLSQAESMAGIR